MPQNKPASMDVSSFARPPRAASIDAVLIRADGTQVPIGTVSAYHSNPLINAWRQWRARRTMARFYRLHPENRPKDTAP